MIKVPLAMISANLSVDRTIGSSSTGTQAAKNHETITAKTTIRFICSVSIWRLYIMSHEGTLANMYVKATGLPPRIGTDLLSNYGGITVYT